jgi:hypothetical protein
VKDLGLALVSLYQQRWLQILEFGSLVESKDVQSQMLLLVDTQQHYYQTQMKQDMEFGFGISQVKIVKI